jgi:hypothetical protein
MPEDNQQDTGTPEPVQNTPDIQAETTPVEPAPVTTAPTTSPETVAVVAEVHNSPGSLVLQWLTYAFWGWTVLALTWLTAISVGFFINRESIESYQSTTVAYSLAAVLVLFVISLICDIFYSRVEPLKKHGAAMVIMIIHAVIFALFGIGALIVAVFAVVRLLIGDGDGSSYGDSGAVTTLITGLIIAVVYGATLLRTLRPFKLKRSGLVYWVFMAIVTIAITTLGIAGPTWNARVTRDDRLIERTLPQLSEAIRSYTAKADKLPANLAEVRDEVTGETRTLIDRNLVEYKPGKEVTASDTNASESTSVLAPDDPRRSPPITPESEKSFMYTLCVTYKAKKGTGQTYPAYDVGGNSISPETYYHEAGRVCYDLTTSYSYGKYY